MADNGGGISPSKVTFSENTKDNSEDAKEDGNVRATNIFGLFLLLRSMIFYHYLVCIYPSLHPVHFDSMTKDT